MPATLKSAFGRGTVEALARAIAAVHPELDATAFVEDAMRGLARKELLARGQHVADALRRHLPADYRAAIEILEASLGSPLPDEGWEALEGQGTAPFFYLPHVCFVRTWGLLDFDASMRAQHALTQRFTAEWSIRPFLEAEPARTLAVLRTWAEDPSTHVRRLVSEGTRPRLPWAPRLRAFEEDPSPALALLELLKDDPSEYVRRSVANHLNDVAKRHPALAVEVAARWLDGASPERRRLVRHALRTLLKGGHAGALALLGHGERPRLAVRAVRVEPARVPVGGRVSIRAALASRADAPQARPGGLAVHFVKASGAARPKIFKLRTVELPPRAVVEVAKTISLAEMSTRTHHPGTHALELLVNGARFPAGAFEVVRGRGAVTRTRRGRALPSRHAR